MPNDKKAAGLVQDALNRRTAFLQPNPYLAQRVIRLAEEEGEPIVKKKLSVGLIVAIILTMMTLTALAVAILSATEFIEQEAVPLALSNDTDTFIQESYTHEELVQIVQSLSENGITLEEDNNIMQAIASGKGYWEEETIMAICREAFGGPHYMWSIEEKHWFDDVMVRIGFKERNPYMIPGEGDMTVAEAKAHAVQLLSDEYGVTLPSESSDSWRLDEWFYASWTDTDGHHPAMWKFEYVNTATGVPEYVVSFDREGNLLDIGEAGFHGEQTAFESYDMADRYFTLKYGSLPQWPLEAWAEFGEAIAPFTPETGRQWCMINAGYRMPPDGAVTGQQAVAIAMADIQPVGQTETDIICCTDNGRAIYKTTLSTHLPGNEMSGAYDFIWCHEIDCMTGEIIAKRQYTYGPESKAIMMYAPFSVVDSMPDFSLTNTSSPEDIAEKERQARAYEAYSAQYGMNWYFWPLEAQKDALGGHHHVPDGDCMTRDQAAETAIAAVNEQLGPDALASLGAYQVGVICCRYDEPDGVRISWLVYITSDPEGMTDGFRVDFDDPAGMQFNSEPVIDRANGQNG